MDQPRFLIPKYVPDVFRNEPRNIGVVLWSPHGVGARFVGERPDTPGEVDTAEVPSFVASPDAYQQWVRYWRRELAKEAIRPAAGDAAVPRTAAQFLDVLGQAGPSNYLLANGGVLIDSVSEAELFQAVDDLFERCVAAGSAASPDNSVIPPTPLDE